MICMFLCFGVFGFYVFIRDDIRSERERRENEAIKKEREIRSAARDEKWDEFIHREKAKRELEQNE